MHRQTWGQMSSSLNQQNDCQLESSLQIPGSNHSQLGDIVIKHHSDKSDVTRTSLPAFLPTPPPSCSHTLLIPQLSNWWTANKEQPSVSIYRRKPPVDARQAPVRGARRAVNRIRLPAVRAWASSRFQTHKATRSSIYYSTCWNQKEEGEKQGFRRW